MQSSVANAPRPKTSRFQVWRSLERDAGAAVTAISNIRKLGRGSILLLHQQGLGPRSYPLRHQPWQALHDCPIEDGFPFRGQAGRPASHLRQPEMRRKLWLECPRG
jgi:hypothetical protein